METFQVFYPDGTVSTVTGGQNSVRDFQEVVKNATEQGLVIECRMEVISHAVYDYKDNNLVNSCLLQFPYGRGGLSEKRRTSKGTFTEVVNIMEYTKYLSMLSLPQFQTELFTLQLYNMQMKYCMLESASWQLRNKIYASILSCQITPTQIYDAIDNTRRGVARRENEQNGGQILLGAIDAICKNIPHTNQAARKARRDIETMQHHFGCPTFFLTVTPDDDNHILVQIYSQQLLSVVGATDELNDEDVLKLANKKKELRIKYPGVCALFFELMIDIIFKDVIGWDRCKNQATNELGGIFGNVNAVTMSVEEQGRRTLHAHILLWVEDLNLIRADLFSGHRTIVRNAKESIIKKVDELCGTKFVFNGEQVRNINTTLHKSFKHECIEALGNDQSYPIAVCDQQVRNLRCKRKHEAAFYCNQNCSKEWSSKDFVTNYLINHVKIAKVSNDYSANNRRLKSLSSEFQMLFANNYFAPRWMVDVAYNHHIHTSSCFKKKSNQYNKTSLCEECRFRNPKRRRRKTVINQVETMKQPWFLWNGTKTERPILEMNLRRSQYDMFQNICCPHIAYSKFTCNNNLSFVLPGTVGHYCTSYVMKNTQQDEVKAYEAVRAASEKIISKVTEDDTPNRVAFRRLLSATFTHQSDNIVGAAMASYLTRNESRFYFSHEMVWCPLRDLEKLLNGEGVTPAIVIRDDNAFFKCEALNYLCRPAQLDDISAFEFYSKYEITKFNNSNCLQFKNSDMFIHPSYCEKTKKFRQGVRSRECVKITKVYQYDFPDTASFGGDILDHNTPVTDTTETYSLKVLLLFLPYRTKHDILPADSHTEHLRQCIAAGLIKNSAFVILQNLQDTKANNLRNMSSNDDLQRNTEVPTTEDKSNIISTNQEEDEDDNNSLLQLNDLAEFSLDIEQFVMGDIETNFNTIPSEFNCSGLRGKGREQCGSERLPDLKNFDISVDRDFVVSSTVPVVSDIQNNISVNRDLIDRDRLVAILICQNQQVHRSFEEITGNQEQVSVINANGSASSIKDWANKSKLDRNQQRAFEIITGAFVLSFYDEAAVGSRNSRTRFSTEKQNLQMLVHRKNWQKNQLICFLHGPGGSGKTVLIDLVLLYSKEFCSYLWSGFQSSERVIVVTAMTGVAATILQGETTHSALYLNQKRSISPEQIEHWASTKMVVIDEVSFADKGDIAKIHNNLCKLKQLSGMKYGGINVVFCGDFRQLEPVGNSNKPIYEDYVPQFKDWVNCYIELNGIWRFKNDPMWGTMLSNIRNGTVSLQEINVINNQISPTDETNGITKRIIPKPKVPPLTRYACYFNKDKDAINTAIFENRIRHSYNKYKTTEGYMLIFADNIQIKNVSGIYVPCTKTHSFYELYSEDDLKMPQGSGRMDLVLKLYSGCRVMLPTNINVSMGQANGTQATVQKIVLKQHIVPIRTLIGGVIPVDAVFASQVDYIELKHTNTKIQPPLFNVSSKKNSFKLKLPITDHYQLRKKTTFVAEMKATQIPILQNSATTGHKLQGSGVDTLFVHKWSNVPNWNYVMLSRIKTMSGLYAREKLPIDITTYKLKPAYISMISKLSKKPPFLLTEEEYANFTT